MKKSEKRMLSRRIGDFNAYMGIKDYTFNEGKAKGVRALELDNGNALRLTVLPDRALDIPYLSYKGKNIGVLGKVGLSSPQYYTEDGMDSFLRQFNAGFFTSCGITYSGVPSTVNGRLFSQHGPLSYIPAEHVGAKVEYEGDNAVIRVYGEMRQVRVGEENVLLKRTYTLETETNLLHIHDEIENLGFTKQPVMLIYHINFGYPILDTCARTYFSTKNVAPRNEHAAEELDKYSFIEEPEDVGEERCYFHTGGDKKAFAMLHNEKLGIAAVVHYDTEQCPIFCQWKNMLAGDFALGLEPTTSSVLGRVYAEENGLLKYLEGGESASFDVSVEFLDDAEKISAYKSQTKEAKL